MTYRDPLDAARARISALEDLLDSPPFGVGVGDPDVREARIQLAEERANHQAELSRVRHEMDAMETRLEAALDDLADERGRRQAEVSLLRSKLEEAERSVQNNRALFDAEQTIQRAEVEVASARLRQQLVVLETTVRELREEVRVHLRGAPRDIKAYYGARVRAVGAELAEHGSLSRRLDTRVREAEAALLTLPPVDTRDREAIVERELAKRKVAIGAAEHERVRARLMRLEEELTRITAAEAELATRA
ncbi:MAG: hypothetical protein AB8I08_34305 [Sandaracinaceae bacterium]